MSKLNYKRVKQDRDLFIARQGKHPKPKKRPKRLPLDKQLPTRRQIKYMKDLGIPIPVGCSKKRAMVLINLKVNGLVK